MGVRVATVMVAAQFLEVSSNTLMKAATAKGMSNFVFIVYSNALAFCLLLPSTLFYHRNRTPPPIKVSLICRIFLTSFLGCAVQTLMCTGTVYSSPTLSSAMVDLVPAYTFILAILLRMEDLDLKLQSSQAKTIGTVVSIAGALVVTLYKGLPLLTTNASQQDKVIILGATLLSQQSHWLLGGFLLAVASFCMTLLLIILTKITEDYPAELMITTISYGYMVILSAIVALVAEQNPKAWIFRTDMELVATIYA
ncbi:hypothetical protein L6164_020598 [Bauhinia variegata]|uniref:Uncharacterized protein n=1 Tax=Bauhinia variegata TaxID=167791 RepID=A0ACB9MVM5_BAUVA|nr:hypothetical protein L6164_020598 [Bauhinia variegata]